MAINCPRCGAGYDATLFQFGHRVECACGQWVDRDHGHVASRRSGKEGAQMAEKEIGKVTHYFSKIGVAAIQLSDTLSVGDTIRVKGHTSDFQQKVDSIQLDNQSVPQAVAGQGVGIRVAGHARQHDAVYKVE